MGQGEVNTVISQLQRVFGRERLNELGRQTGYLKRRRVIEPFRILSATVAALAQAGTDALADIHRMFNGLHGQQVQYKPFHNQLAKTAFGEFTRACACVALGELTSRALEPTGKELSRFKAIWIQDGTSFALHERLQETFPGRFTKFSPSAVELHVRMDLLNGMPDSVTLTPDTSGEREQLPQPEELVDTLLLADRGYFALDYWHQVSLAGGFFVVRGTSRINPCVETARRSDGRLITGVGGKHLKDIGHKLPKRADADMDISWQLRNGGGLFRCRLIARWNPEKKRHEYLVTNLPRAEYDLVAMECLYRLRWQIELLFKEWKSYSSLQRFNTEKAPIAEGLIWASLIALVLKRYIAASAQKAAGVWLSWQKVAKTAGFWLLPMTKAFASGSKTSLAAAYREAIAYLRVNAQRAHPGRDAETGLTRYGLAPVIGSA